MTHSPFAKELACQRWHDFAARIVIRRLLSTLILLSFATGLAHAALPGGLDAATLETDPQTGDLVGTGNARLTYEDALLTADQIRYNVEKQTATARGHVALTRGSRRFLADEIVYHLNDKTYTVTRMRVGDAPLYASGELLDGSEKEVVLHRAKLSYHEPSPVTPILTAETLRIIPGDRVIAEKANLGVGFAPIVPMGHFEQNINDPLLSHATARVGYDKNLGAFADIGLHLPISPGVKLGGDVGLYTARGLLLGPSGTYDVIKEDSREVGSFKSGYIYDFGDTGHDVLNRPINANRGFIQWDDERTTLAKNFSMVTRFNYWSDSAITRDFRPDDFYPVQEPDSFAEFAGTADNVITSVFFRVQPNTFQHIQQRLPEVRVDALPNALGLGIYQRFSASAAALRERQFSMVEQPGEEKLVHTTAPTVKSNRLDAFYGLSRPIAPREWLVIDPVAGARVTHYLNATNGKDTYTRALGELGLDASMRSSGMYTYQNERWGIDGIRHLVTPKVSYRYIPEADKGRPYIPQIDDRVFDTALPPLELGDQRNIDDLSATNTLRVGLDNTFQTRDKTYGSRDLLTLNLAEDFYIRPNDGEKDYSELHTGLSFMPARWIQFDVYYTFPPQNFTTRELNTRLYLHDGNLWALGISTHYLRDQIEEYMVEGRYRVNETYSAVARLRYDAQLSRLNECSLGIHQNLSNIWSIKYEFNYYQGRQRESPVGFSISAVLIGL